MNSTEPEPGKGASFAAGILQLVGGGITVLAAVLVGGGLGGVVSMARGSRFAEHVLSGMAIGAIAGIMRATGYPYSWGLAIGAFLAWNLGSFWDPLLGALMTATLGGWIGATVQRKLLGAPREAPERSPSARSLIRRALSVLMGLALGGFLGGVLGAWLCMVVAFRAFLPSQLSPTLDQGGLLIFFAGFVGSVIGAVVNARCFYVWVVRREVPPRIPEDVIGDYQRWKGQHAPPPANDTDNS